MAVRVADATDGRMPDAQRCFFIVLFVSEKRENKDLSLSKVTPHPSR